MIAPLRIAAEKIVNITENVQEELARIRGIHTLRVPILMYHHVAIPSPYEKNPQLYISPELFAKEMKFLADNGYVTITLDGLAEALKERKKIPKKSIILTFDDGYLDFYSDAFPVLKKYGMKSTIFVTVNFINMNGYLTEHHLHQLIKSRIVKIGSHSLNHRDLTKIKQRNLSKEVEESKELLEKELNIQITSFAYPYGLYNRKVLFEIVRRGYLNAVSTNYGCLHSVKRIMVFRRIRLGKSISFADFKRRIENSYQL